MSEEIRVGDVSGRLRSKTSGNPLAKFKNGQAVNILEGEVAKMFNYAARQVWDMADERIGGYMSQNVYPSYDRSVADDMERSISHRIDRRKRGTTMTLEVEHPLLFAREYGKTTTGATEFKSSSGKPMRVPLSRVLASKAFMGISQKKIDDAIAYFRHAKSEGTAQGDEAAIFFTRAKVGREPFMDDLEEIISDTARELMIETIGKLPADAIGRMFGA